jgi:Flp pilus assembly protein TadG
MKQQHTRAGRRRGVVAIFVAVNLVALVGMTALSVDGGLVHFHLRRVRATADAAAMAAATELFRTYPAYEGQDPTDGARDAALAVAKANGFDNDGTTSKVEVNIPPTSGPYTGRAGYAEVIVTFNAPRGFSRVFGASPIPVKARAVARGAWVAPQAGVIILDYHDRAALNSQGNGAFTEAGGPVIINSNDPDAVVTSGNGKIIAEEFYITGGVSLDGNAYFETQPDPDQIFLGTHPTPDPLEYLPPPSIPPDGTITTTSLAGGKKQYVLTPGRYSNLPSFSSGDVVILKQASANSAGGIYYLDEGGFISTGATLTMDPDTTGGVMLYNAPPGDSTSHKVKITGNPSGTVNLAPLTEGPYKGIVLWQRREATVPVDVEGNGNFNIEGTFYIAGGELQVAGNAKTSGGEVTGYYLDDDGVQVEGGSRIGSQFVVRTLALSGNGNVNIHYQAPEVARTRIIALVE